MAGKFSSIESVVQAMARGETVIVLDAEDRENEGDFICASEKVTPEVINFMVTHGRGRICTAVLPELARRLDLPLMVERATDTRRTAFTITVDHFTVRTGITAAERAITIRALVDPATQATDLVRPGHVDPLIAKEGGVLRRAGHTEAAADLARMAGLMASGTLCEVLNESGDRATRDELLEMAAQFDMQITTIEELIRYRRRSERLVERIDTADAKLPTPFGDFRILAYQVKYEAENPVVLVLGEPASMSAPLVRLHSACFTGDVLESLRCDCGSQLRLALDMIGREGGGVLVYLPQEGRGIGLIEKIKAYKLQDEGMDTVEANLALGHGVDQRDYGIGIQVLKDLGLSRVRLLTNNPKKTDAFIYGGFELEVVDQVPILPPIHEHNARYLATKRDRMGHQLPEDS